MKLLNKIKSTTSSVDEKLHKHPFFKFIFVLLIIILYGAFTIHIYGVKDGFLVSVLTWSFFVLCTPIADAGILLDFPVRLLTGMKMRHTEMMVWGTAITLNTIMYVFNPKIYDNTMLLSLFKHILQTPIPYWSIIILSCIGTFLSIYFADSLLDKKRNTKQNLIVKHKVIIFVFLITLTLLLYDFLLNKLGVSIFLI